MKKILFVVACLVAVGFTSCGKCNKSTSVCDSDSVKVDTVAVDTVVAVADTLVADSL